MMTQTLSATQHHSLAPELSREIERTRTNCSQCGHCVDECPFLARYGDPKDQATNYNPAIPELLARPFKCTLCGLCSEVCSDGVNPSRMFLEMRREAFVRGLSDLPEHRGLRKYERTGNSKAYTWYALPDGCDAIFFPGCALVGSRAETTSKVFEKLQQIIPTIGIVLDCCNKPSHDLGDPDHFKKMFTEMHSYFVERGIKRVLVACPNCLKIFNQYAPDLVTRTVYEMLAEHPLSDFTKVAATVTIHDPCVSRADAATQIAVRQLLERAGAKVEEMPHSRDNTICCGEGGGAGRSAPDLAQRWIEQRLTEAGTKPIISYCAGCTNSFSAHTTTAHVLDLVFSTKTALTPQHKVTRAPMTYVQRLVFKRRLQREFPAATASVRPSSCAAKKAKPKAFITLTILSTLLVGVAVILRFSPF